MRSRCIVRSKSKDIPVRLRLLAALLPPYVRTKAKPTAQKSVEPELATMVNPEEGKKKRPPTALQIAHWMTFFKEEQRLEWQHSYLTQLCEKDSQIAQTYELIQEFTSMLREREGEHLDEWLERVEKQGVVELQSFAEATQEGL